MLIDRFANIVSAILSLTGVMFVLKGVSRLSPDLIAKITQTHLDVNLMHLQTLASQKADFISGASLVLFAFLIQAFALVFIREPFEIFGHYWYAAGLAVGISLLVIIAFFGVNQGISNHYQEQAKFTLAKSYFETLLKQDPILPEHLKTTEDVALSLFGIGKEPDEDGRDFLRRLAERFEISLPEKLRFEQERPPGRDSRQPVDGLQNNQPTLQGR